MVRRITITIEDNLEGKIRDIQIKKISETRKSVSFSHVLNDLLKQALKEEEYKINQQYV